jgi:hypothetical protein
MWAVSSPLTPTGPDDSVSCLVGYGRTTGLTWPAGTLGVRAQHLKRAGQANLILRMSRARRAQVRRHRIKRLRARAALERAASDATPSLEDLVGGPVFDLYRKAAAAHAATLGEVRALEFVSALLREVGGPALAAAELADAHRDLSRAAREAARIRWLLRRHVGKARWVATASGELRPDRELAPFPL